MKKRIILLVMTLVILALQIQPVMAEYDSSTYDPINFMANAFSGGLAVGWKNPPSENIKKIELYDITSGEDVFLSSKFDTEESKVNQYKAAKLTNGQLYHYKLHFEFHDGTETEFFTFGIPQSADKQLSPWSITLNKGNDYGYSAIDYSIDVNEKHTGNASLKVTSNIVKASNVYGLLSRNFNVETGANYQFKFWAKAINNNSSWEFTNNWNLLDGNKNREVADFKGTYDWKEFTIDIKEISTANIKFLLLMKDTSESVWFDDFSLVKIEDDQPVGENLFTDGDFENFYVQSNVGKINGLSGVGSDETVKLTWKSTSGANKIKVYQVIDGVKYSRGYISSAMTDLTITNLSNDTEHTFALAGVDEIGNEGEATEVTVRTIASDFKIYDPILYKTGVEVQELSYGRFEVRTEVKNNKSDESIPVIQMVALYKGNVLKSLVSDSVVAEKGVPVILGTGKYVNVPYKDHEQYHIEVFLWDSKDGMNSLFDFVTFGQTN